MEISGELGKKGLHQKLCDLIIPRYNPYEHSPLVGMNILQSYLETGMYNEGIRLLNKLKTLNRHDLMNYFDYYNEFYKYNN